MDAQLKKILNKEIKSAKHWTKEYLEAIFICLEENNYDEAEYYAMLIAPLWGQLESTITENRLDKE